MSWHVPSLRRQSAAMVDQLRLRLCWSLLSRMCRPTRDVQQRRALQPRLGESATLASRRWDIADTSIFAQNPHILYALTVTYQRFNLLANFTLAQGIAEARRLRAARRERQQRTSSSATSLRPINEGVAASARTSEDHPGASSEKALGKRRERTLSLGSLADLTLASPSSPNLSRTTSNTSGGPLSPTMSEAGETGDEQRPFVGKNGFVPTTEWVAAWREGCVPCLAALRKC